jgi:hypothetical protein
MRTYPARARGAEATDALGPHPPIRGARSPAPLAPAPRGRYTVVTINSHYKGKTASTSGGRRAGGGVPTSSWSDPTGRAARSGRRSSSTWAVTRGPRTRWRRGPLRLRTSGG